MPRPSCPTRRLIEIPQKTDDLGGLASWIQHIKTIKNDAKGCRNILIPAAVLMGHKQQTLSPSNSQLTMNGMPINGQKIGAASNTVMELKA